MPSKKEAERHVKILAKALKDFEAHNPTWRENCLIWVLDKCLRRLKFYIESASDTEISWLSPFVQLRYPVECVFSEDKKFTISYGTLTEKELESTDTIVGALSEILVRALELDVLQQVTAHVAYFQEGDSITPLLDDETAEQLLSIGSEDDRAIALQALLQPCSFGAGTIEYPEDMKEGDTIPVSVQAQLEKIHPPLLMLSCGSVLRPADVISIFEVSPLVVDFEKKTAHFPITVGLSIITDYPENESPPWEQFEKWPPPMIVSLWERIFEQLAEDSHVDWPEHPLDTTHTTHVIHASLEVLCKGGESVEELQRRTLEQFQSLGKIIKYEVNSYGCIPSFDIREAMKAYDLVESTRDSDAKGKALEALIALLFGSINGFTVESRIKTQTEEIDLLVENRSDDYPFKKEGDVILVECKNWAKKCGKDELVVFLRKLENRGSRCTIGFLISWGGFARTVALEMLRSQVNSPIVVLLDKKQILSAIEAGDFLSLLVSARKNAIMT